MKPDFAQYGFAHQNRLIMAHIGGSQAHGAKVGATDDTDWYGLYIPPADRVLGLHREEHFVFTTGGKVMFASTHFLSGQASPPRAILQLCISCLLLSLSQPIHGIV